MMDHDPQNKEARLERLSRRNSSSHQESEGYSNFVRIMRITLPLAALAVVFVLFTGSNVEESIISPIEEEKEQLRDQHIAQNELINPKFESMDKKSQPYVITADRAVQGDKNKDLIMLDQPKGTVTMQSGRRVNVSSATGAYRQDTERFFLQGGVFLRHDDGYVLQSEEAHIDLKESFAWSEKAVQGQGPDIAIEASGMHANGKTGEVVFTGPARLILEGGMEGLE